MLPTDKSQLSQEFLTLVEIVAALRGPNGCPWDKEQTQGTLTQYAIEEAHELAEAIESGNPESPRPIEFQIAHIVIGQTIAALYLFKQLAIDRVTE